MFISGIGIVFTRGRGIDSFENALKEGWIAPSWTGSLPAYRVGQETLTDASLSKKIRRADRFSRMAVLSAVDAYRDSGITVNEKEKLGIVLATAFGPHATAFSFIDDILDYSDANVSPTKFSNSVHNAAASYVSAVLDSRGPTVTLTQFKFAFQNALILAGSWIAEGRCDHVLCGCADELGTVMEYACKMKLNIAKDGKINPFNFSDSPVSVPGEGSVFIMLSKEKGCNNYGKVTETSFSQNITGKPDLFVIDTDGMSGNESGYRDIINYRTVIAGYSPVFGSMLTGSAFNFAASALMLKNQVAYKCIFQDNPFGAKLCVETSAKNLDEIYCIRICRPEVKTIVKLQK
jgi:3-oxoacyl-[acyl-carrier-protein] synthase II